MMTPNVSSLDQAQLTYLVLFSSLLTILIIISFVSLVYLMFFRDALFESNEHVNYSIPDNLKHNFDSYKNDELYNKLNKVERLRLDLAKKFYQYHPPALDFNNSSDEVDTTYLLIRDRGIGCFYFENYQDQLSELIQNVEDEEIQKIQQEANPSLLEEVVNERTSLLPTTQKKHKKAKKVITNYREAQFSSTNAPYYIEDLTEINFVSELSSSAMLNLPLPLKNRKNDTVYFEVKIFDFDYLKTNLSIGLSSKPYPNFQMPGLHPYSIAVQSDGCLRLNNKPFINDDDLPVIMPQIIEGDVIGFGYKSKNGSLYVTHNGKKILEIVKNLKIELYPIIGSNGAPCKVSINLGQLGFVFIEANVKKLGFCENQNEGLIGAPPFYSPKVIKNDVLLDQGEILPPHYPSDEDTFFGPKSLVEKSIRIGGQSHGQIANVDDEDEDEDDEDEDDDEEDDETNAHTTDSNLPRNKTPESDPPSYHNTDNEKSSSSLDRLKSSSDDDEDLQPESKLTSVPISSSPTLDSLQYEGRLNDVRSKSATPIFRNLENAIEVNHMKRTESQNLITENQDVHAVTVGSSSDVIGSSSMDNNTPVKKANKKKGKKTNTKKKSKKNKTTF